MKAKPLYKEVGFTKVAESLNGRLAMLAFTIAIVVEILTGHGFLAFLKLI
jgi:hypothetical protein